MKQESPTIALMLETGPVQQRVSQLLNTSGYDVVVTSSPAELIKLAQRELVDLVLLGITFEHLENAIAGLNIQKELYITVPTLPIVLCSDVITMERLYVAARFMNAISILIPQCQEQGFTDEMIIATIKDSLSLPILPTTQDKRAQACVGKRLCVYNDSDGNHIYSKTGRIVDVDHTTGEFIVRITQNGFPTTIRVAMARGVDYMFLENDDVEEEQTLRTFLTIS